MDNRFTELTVEDVARVVGGGLGLMPSGHSYVTRPRIAPAGGDRYFGAQPRVTMPRPNPYGAGTGSPTVPNVPMSPPPRF
jgi:hypothetical protein